MRRLQLITFLTGVAVTLPFATRTQQSQRARSLVGAIWARRNGSTPIIARVSEAFHRGLKILALPADEVIE